MSRNNVYFSVNTVMSQSDVYLSANISNSRNNICFSVSTVLSQNFVYFHTIAIMSRNSVPKPPHGVVMVTIPRHADARPSMKTSQGGEGGETEEQTAGGRGGRGEDRQRMQGAGGKKKAEEARTDKRRCVQEANNIRGGGEDGRRMRGSNFVSSERDLTVVLCRCILISEM